MVSEKEISAGEEFDGFEEGEELTNCSAEEAGSYIECLNGFAGDREKH